MQTGFATNFFLLTKCTFCTFTCTVTFTILFENAKLSVRGKTTKMHTKTGALILKKMISKDVQF